MINRANVRLNEQEAELLEMYCERHKVNVSDAVRSFILNIKTDHEVEAEERQKQLEQLKIAARQKAMRAMGMED